MNLLTVSFGIASLAAAVYLFEAARGRRIGADPYCRKCGFDLVGHARRPARCPECGASFSGQRAIRTGRRLRSGGTIALGWCAVAILVCGAALEWGPAAAGSRWSAQSIKPTDWLVVDALRGRGPQAGVLAELVRRIAAGELTGEQAGPLVQRALEIQADLVAPWDPEWGRVVESCGAAGMLSTEDRTRYVGQALVAELSIERPFRAGEVHPRLAVRLERVGDAAFDVQGLRAILARVEVGGEELALRKVRGWSRNGSGPAAVFESDGWRCSTAAPWGEHEVTVTWRIEIDPASMAGNLVAGKVIGGLPKFSRTFTVSARSTVLETDVDPFVPVEDQAQLAEIERILAAGAKLSVYPGGARVRLALNVNAKDCPAAVDATAVLMVGSVEIPLSGDRFRLAGSPVDPGYDYRFGHASGNCVELPDGPVTVRLDPTTVPDPHAWRRALDDRESIPLVGRPLVLRNIKVEVREPEGVDRPANGSEAGAPAAPAAAPPPADPDEMTP